MSSSSLSIHSNIASLMAQRQLASATNSLSSSFEKLSSGLCINKASDDAAGLSMASSLKADTRIFSQGLRNLNDGVSALNIADGALANLSSIVIRMQELAEQSANGAVGWRQRASLDSEAQALANEYFRISRTTDLNGLKLFDGSIQGISLQAGYGSGGSIVSSLGGALGTGTFGDARTYGTEAHESDALRVADLNGDGLADLVTAGNFYDADLDETAGFATIRLGNGDGTFQATLSYATETLNSFDLSVSDVNGDGVMDLMTAGYSIDGGCVTLRLGNGDGTFRKPVSYESEEYASNAIALSDLNNDGILDLASAGQKWGSGGVATIRLGNGDGTFRSSFSYQMEGEASNSVSLAEVNGDGILDLVTAGNGGLGVGAFATIRLGNGNGSFRSATSYGSGSGTSSVSHALSICDVNGDGLQDMVTAGGSGVNGEACIRLGNGDGTFRSMTSYRGEDLTTNALSMSDINGDRVLDFVTAGHDAGGGTVTIRLGNDNGTFKSGMTYQAEDLFSKAIVFSDLNGDGVSDLVSAGCDDTVGYSTVRLSNTKEGISPILPFSLKTQADALQSIPMLKGTLDRLSAQRGQIGAFQSRITSALHTLGSAVLEYKGAQSRVEDVDVASESAVLVRQQILQQAASSVLAQANQIPRLAIALLNG